ncbi:MAG: hypothetical protein J0L96_05660 [Anaerolineae bacterium]|nr:hypothetical protein [Anaerolineae bacterium]
MRKNFNVLCIVFMLLISACNAGVGQPVVEETSAVVNVPIVEQVQAATNTPAVQHAMIPAELPELQSGLAGDQDSSSTADENRAPAGDRFTFGRYERPFNASEMDVYYPGIDIQAASVFEDDNWVYGTIAIKEDAASECSFNGRYGFEVDWNIDGGGDLLVLALTPSSTEWTTANVEVWFDENDDVGGALKNTSDEATSQDDGYESQIFGGGIGEDPDMAWVRISPTDSCTVQIALKQAALEGNMYLIGMWAGNDQLDPALFDHNDGVTHEQAGSPLKEFEFFYPLKEINELDNVCRMAVGFQPNGSEPGVCPVPSAPIQDTPPPPGQSCPPPSILYCSPNGCYCLSPQG